MESFRNLVNSFGIPRRHPQINSQDEVSSTHDPPINPVGGEDESITLLTTYPLRATSSINSKMFSQFRGFSTLFRLP